MKRFLNILGLGAVVAAAIAIGASSARGADLGGSCCADLEERVAELEATVAKKGNRKIALEVSGQVSKSIMWVDGNDAVIGDNANSQSRFRFTGTGRASENVTVGYTLELGAEDAITVRHSFVHVEYKGIGKVSLGRTSMASDGISEVSLANTNIANLPSTIYGPLVDGPRDNVVKVESATLFGFTASASWASDDAWDVALRYSHDFGVVRFAAGIAYAEDLIVGERVSGSASVMHTPTGIFGNLVAARSDDVDVDVLHFTGGIERNFTGIGATTLFAEAGKLEAVGFNGDGWGFGVVQKIDAAVLDIFAAYRSVESVDVVHAGMRVQF